MQSYDTVIIGASFYGCGLAIGMPGSKILEPAIVTGAEFSLAINPGSDWDALLQTAEARACKEELQRRKGLNAAGQATVAAFTPILSACCQAQQLDIEFSCSVIQQTGDCLLVVGVGGPREIRAGRVISALPNTSAGQKSLTGIVSLVGTLPDGDYGPFFLRNSCRQGEAYLRLFIPAEEPWPEARQRFHATWDQRASGLSDARLLLLATSFAWPGAANPVLALDRGIREGRAVQC